jgi:hypothetical protein
MTAFWINLCSALTINHMVERRDNEQKNQSDFFPDTVYKCSERFIYRTFALCFHCVWLLHTVSKHIYTTDLSRSFNSYMYVLNSLVHDQSLLSLVHPSTKLHQHWQQHYSAGASQQWNGSIICRKVDHTKFIVNLMQGLFVKSYTANKVTNLHADDNRVRRMRQQHFPQRIILTEKKSEPKKMMFYK